jgi:polyferredoxin
VVQEQVCIVVCPYGRLQGVLLDKNSILVAYDYNRGEPRGKYTKEQKEEKHDCKCTDCKGTGACNDLADKFTTMFPPKEIVLIVCLCKGMPNRDRHPKWYPIGVCELHCVY